MPAEQPYHQLPQLANRFAIQRLTAVWALCESGLGGMLFALKIPLTGFLVGAMAVILLTLIAHAAQNTYKDILSSLVLVLIVKAAVSPHSPPTAYLAVAFQGFTAACLFSWIKNQRLAALLLGMLAMAESALQKLIVLTILFGKGLWDSIDIFFHQLSKELHLSINHDFSVFIIITYLLIYTVWGVIVGGYAGGLPESIELNKNQILQSFTDEELLQTAPEHAIEKTRNGKHKLYMVVGTILFMALVFYFGKADTKAVWWLLLRTVTVLLFIFFIAAPLAKWLLLKWLNRKKSAHANSTAQILQMLPQVRSFAGLAYKKSSRENNWFKRAASFITILVVLSVYAQSESYRNL